MSRSDALSAVLWTLALGLLAASAFFQYRTYQRLPLSVRDYQEMRELTQADTLDAFGREQLRRLVDRLPVFYLAGGERLDVWVRGGDINVETTRFSPILVEVVR